MKKLVSLILTAFMLISTVPLTVSAAAEFTPGAGSSPFTNASPVEQIFGDNTTISLTVNDAYFTSFEEANKDLFNLSASPADFSNYFNYEFIRDANQIRVQLTAKNGAFRQSREFDLNYTYDSQSTGSTPLKLKATIEPAGTSISGFAATINPQPAAGSNTVISGTTVQATAGQSFSFTIPVTGNWFQHVNGQTPAVTAEKLNEQNHNLTVSPLTAGYTAFRSGTTITVNSDGSSSSDKVELALSLTNSEGNSVTAQISVPVSLQSQTHAENPGSSKITGFKAGTAPQIVSVPGDSMAKGGTVRFNMPAGNFDYDTTTAADINANLGVLRGMTNQVSFTGNAGSLFDVSFEADGNNNVVMVLTAKSTGTLQAGSTLQTRNGTAVTISSNAVNIYDPAAAKITGVNTGSTISWNMPPSMLLNETFIVTFTPANFTWEDGNAGGKKIAVADVQKYFEYTPKDYLSATWTQDGNNVRLTLKAIKTGENIPVTVKPQSAYGSSPTISGSLSIKAGDAITGVNSGSTISWNMPATIDQNGTFTVTFTPANFTWADGNSNGKKITASDVQKYFDYTPKDYLSATWAQDGNNVKLTLKAVKAGDNIDVAVKPQSAYGTSPTISGKLTIKAGGTTAGNKITGISGNSYLGSNMTLNGRKFSDDQADMTIEPGSVLYLDIDSDFFTWEKGQPTTANVTTGMLSNGKIAVKVSKKTGGDIISNVSVVSEGGRARIKVEFAKNFNSFTEKRFSATVYLTVNGKRHTDSEVVIAGVIQNETQYATSGQDWYDLEDIPVIEAEDTIRNAELYVGNGVTIHTTLSKNRQYYAASDINPTSSDMQLMDRYSAIEQVISLNTKNITSNAKVSFDLGPSRYHVYDKDRKYLGTTNQKLPLSSKYYIASRQISFSVSDGGSGSSIVEVPGGSSSTSSLPNDYSSAGSGSTGGTGSTGSGNNNYNPPTGSTSVKIMVLISTLMLAGGAVIGLTRKRKY